MKKDLPPISLTPCISKIAEIFAVCDYVKPAVSQVLDSNQFRAFSRYSTTLSLLAMLHTWLRSLMEMVPLSELSVLTFYLIDHSKLRFLYLPVRSTNWITDFLSYPTIFKARESRFSLGMGIGPLWGPSGQKIKPWIFVIRIKPSRCSVMEQAMSRK